nr:zinc finger with ufm1-specific peptidase domain protein [Quercus suber]
MPARTAAIISNEDHSNTFPNVIPRLIERLDRDKHVEAAYLCSPAAAQVYKLPDEGPYFCGYRNLQMMLLALGSTRPAPPSSLHTELPSFENKVLIPQLQSLIEAGWSKGYNSHARIQTGGIKDTRKFIGTSEAEALFLSLEIPCTGTVFQGNRAWEELLDAVERYFTTTASTISSSKVHRTDRMPIFLQRPRHSITVVGIERTTKGKRRLLVFDPAWRPPRAVRQEGLPARSWDDRFVLRRYRKSESYLRKYQDSRPAAIRATSYVNFTEVDDGTTPPNCRSNQRRGKQRWASLFDDRTKAERAWEKRNFASHYLDPVASIRQNTLATYRATMAEYAHGTPVSAVQCR